MVGGGESECELIFSLLACCLSILILLLLLLVVAACCCCFITALFAVSVVVIIMSCVSNEMEYHFAMFSFLFLLGYLDCKILCFLPVVTFLVHN